jgi:threonine/homoserine/homoserine lactone efflux protein
MDWASLTLFVSALLIASGTPGPGIATLVARVLGTGIGGAVPIALGLAVGDVIWLSAGVWGLSALAQSFAGIFLAVKLAGIAYLIYLAWRMWSAPVASRDVAADTRTDSAPALFVTGLAVCLGNPKVMAFYWALVPTLIDVTKITVAGWLQLVVATLGCLTITFGGYILAANRARTLFKQGDVIRVVNRVAAVAIAGTAIWMALR